MIRTINALLHAVGLDASLIGTLLLSLSTIAGTEISNPSWVNFQSAGWVSFQSAPTRIDSRKADRRRRSIGKLIALQKSNSNSCRSPFAATN
ncbi:hypothetical protein EAH78_31365 [Pseudomonas arsenicoxydans]|uniref:Uncharacterized protein n=1 Tax=Pseudomonas arsenicoxydans TaxID=702115 RepID=A0A502GWK6_9PSED|nr:hypothetical protein EAH78_31365 [Pseudomonas arsenicoxydans]